MIFHSELPDTGALLAGWISWARHSRIRLRQDNHPLSHTDPQRSRTSPVQRRVRGYRPLTPAPHPRAYGYQSRESLIAMADLARRDSAHHTSRMITRVNPRNGSRATLPLHMQHTPHPHMQERTLAFAIVNEIDLLVKPPRLVILLAYATEYYWYGYVLLRRPSWRADADVAPVALVLDVAVVTPAGN